MGWVLLIAGLALWTGAHLLRSVAPDLRDRLQDRLGNGSKGVMALLILASVLLMVLGYRAAPVVIVWSPPAFLTHVNNLLMLFAFYVYLQTMTKPGTAFVMGNTRNPQLTGFKIWAVAHLLVNGDLASILLFLGLLGWAVAEVIASKKLPSLVNRDKAKITSPVVHLGLTLVVVAVVMGLHHLLGVTPWG